MLSEDEMYICATPGEIFYTSDNGVVWDSEYYNYDPSMYKVIILDNGVGLSCGSGSSGGTIIRKLAEPVGVVEYQLDGWNLYPNPVNEELNFNFTVKHENVFNLRIINSLGKVVYAEKLSVFSGRNSKQIEVNQMSEGNYILSITNKEEQVQIEKFQIIR
jgi:hypothetical protein